MIQFYGHGQMHGSILQSASCHVLKQIIVFSVVTNIAATNRMLQTLQNVHQCNYHLRFVSQIII